MRVLLVVVSLVVALGCRSTTQPCQVKPLNVAVADDGDATQGGHTWDLDVALAQGYTCQVTGTIQHPTSLETDYRCTRCN